MPRDYTTDGLLDSIKRRGSLPINQSTWTAARVIEQADETLRDSIVPLVRGHRSDHFTRSEDVTLTASAEYPIPEEAMHRGIKNVAILDTDGEPFSLVAIDFDREIAADYYYPGYREHLGRSRRARYYLRGDTFHIFPTTHNLSGKTLRFYYERIPNHLVATADAALVSSVDTGTGQVTCASVPSSWATGIVLDGIAGKPGFGLRFERSTSTDVTGSVVTLPTADVADLAAGDWLAPEEDSPIPQVPVEVQSILYQEVTLHILVSLNDTEAASSAAQVLEGMKQNYIMAYPNRIDEAPMRIGSRNRLSDYVGH